MLSKDHGKIIRPCIAPGPPHSSHLAQNSPSKRRGIDGSCHHQPPREILHPNLSTLNSWQLPWIVALVACQTMSNISFNFWVPSLYSVDVTTVKENSKAEVTRRPKFPVTSPNFNTGSATVQMPGIWRQKWLPARYHSQPSWNISKDETRWEKRCTSKNQSKCDHLSWELDTSWYILVHLDTFTSLYGRFFFTLFG